MITDRERWLMQQAIGATTYYKDVDDWLGEVISGSGNTVADSLDFYANLHQAELAAICEKD